MRAENSGRRRKAPKNTEWRGDILHGRIRIKGKLRRWSLRTGDVELARQLVTEDIARLKAAVCHDGSRVRYAKLAAAWAERHILHQVGPRTARRYAQSLKMLEPFLGGPFKADEDGVFVDEITLAKCREIVDARRADGVSTATIRRDLTALASVLGYGEVDPNPARQASVRLRERRDPIVLPELAHIERVIARCPPTLGNLARAALLTGCRLDELVMSERTRLDHTHRQLTVIGKGNKLRVLDLSADAYAVLRALPARLGCRWLFWQGDGLALKDVSGRFSKQVAAELKAAIGAAEKAGHDEPGFRKFRFHDLRHRYAVDYLRNRVGSIYDLQGQLGHSTIVTTEWYLRFLTPEEKRTSKYGANSNGQGDGRQVSQPH